MVIDKECSVKSAASNNRVTDSIVWIRDQKVMLSTVLADMYDVEPRVLIQAVKRNIQRFPKDFMFQLTRDEVDVLKSQNVISKTLGRGGAHRSLPYAFTEQGVAMLSSVLKSERAVAINIEIMRTRGLGWTQIATGSGAAI